MNRLFSRLAPALALSLPLLAFAQQRPDAANARGQATPLRYLSAFADYRPWQDIKPGNWRKLNDDLVAGAGSAGAHATHGMHDAAPATPAKASAPTAPAHQGHQMHQIQGGKQ